VDPVKGERQSVEQVPGVDAAAAEWHDRWLPGLLHRLEHGPLALDCSNAHTPRATAAYADTPDTSANARLDRWLNTEAQGAQTGRPGRTHREP
jgi:hypothetical protein